jgi:pilus assembly protein CpaF
MSFKDRIFGSRSDASHPLPRLEPAVPAAAAPAPAPVAPTESPKRPPVNPELEWKKLIHEKLLRQLDFVALSTLSEEVARPRIRAAAETVIQEENLPLPAAVRARLAKEIEDEILGLGPLEPLMADPTVADILVNGANSIYVERRGVLERVDMHFRDNAHLLHIIDRIVTRVGRRVDEASPMVDARLLDGSRVNAIIPPLALDGPLLSIRKFAKAVVGMEQLIKVGALTPQMAEVLKGCVHVGLNILISGGTGSGKTTMLNALSAYIPETERIVTIEDSAELQLLQPHIARLETRPPNIEGQGAVTQRDLLRNALRMRPDRIVVGEVRAGETLDMLQAMNTGHDGSMTTIHANTPRDALGRIENLVAMAGFELPLSATRRQIASGINVVIQLERLPDGKRRMTSLQEITGMEGDIVTMSEIFGYRRKGVDHEGKILGEFRATGVIPAFRDVLASRGFVLDLSLFNPSKALE